MTSKGAKGAKGFPGKGPDDFKGKGFPAKGMPGKGFPMHKGALPKGTGKGPPGQPGPQAQHPGMCKGGGPQGPHPGPCKGYGMAHPGGLMAPAPMAPMQPQPAPEIRPQAAPSPAEPAPADAVKASPAARRKTLGPLMPPLLPTALRPDSPVQALEEFGGWPAAEGASGTQMPTPAAADPVAVAPAAMPAMPSASARPAPSMSPAPAPESAPASTPASAPPPAASSPAMSPAMPPAMPGMPSMPSANGDNGGNGVSRREASRKTATQLRSELNRLREEMERQSAQGKTSSSDADELKEELRRLQKQFEESERENQELRAKQSAPGESAPRRRGRKSMRNRTMDLTAHRNADWEEAGGTSAEESDVSDDGEDLDALLGLAKVR